jgi:hypothetical protein
MSDASRRLIFVVRKHHQNASHKFENRFLGQ